MKPIRLTTHARQQCAERGATEEEVVLAVHQGTREPAKTGRTMCRYNLPYNREWQAKTYAVKQVAPVVKEESGEIVVVTVYTFYF
jgi:hypothetical protein